VQLEVSRKVLDRGDLVKHLADPLAQEPLEGPALHFDEIGHVEDFRNLGETHAGAAPPRSPPVRRRRPARQQMWENASSYLGSGFSRGTGHLQQQFLSRDGVITGLGGTRPHRERHAVSSRGITTRMVAGMMGFNEKRKQGRQARFRFSALNSKVPVVGVSSVKSRIPHTTRRDTARQYPALASSSCESHVDPEARVPPGQDPPGEHPSGLLDFDWAPFGLKLGLDLLGLDLDTFSLTGLGAPSTRSLASSGPTR